MRSELKISVIVPVYNVENYLRGCLDSLIAQTFSSYEAICINDGSTDNSQAILEEYAKKDSRFKIISQDNKGLSVARNIGMDSAGGSYIFFLDSDDYIHPQALEFLHRCAVENDVELVCAGYKGNPDLYSPMNASLNYLNIRQEVFNRPIKAYFREYKRKIPGMVWTKLYKTEMIKDIRFIDGRLYEDECFTALVMEKCRKVVRLDFDMYNYYYGRGDAITGKFDENVLNSHLSNISFLCEHFAYDAKLLDIIKRGKVAGILFNSCCKSLPYLSVEKYMVLSKVLSHYVEKAIEEGLIKYTDFGLLNRYKLYKIVTGKLK